MQYAIYGLILAGIGAVIYLQIMKKDTSLDGAGILEESAKLKAELEQKNQKIGELQSLVEQEKADNQERQGKSKQLFAQMTKMEAQMEQLVKERDTLQKLLAKHDEALERREKEFEHKLAKLEQSQIKLDQERERVQREDLERIAQLEAERDRLWADHETNVIASLTDICKQPTLSFSSYTNTNLPDGFDGSLKPDFMIEFLGQYIIFDAKVSKAKSLKTYIDDQVKKTVQKVKDNERIYKTIFLVVPTSAISELKSHTYQVDGYTLHVICPESIPPILSSLKHITRYEFAEQMDPQQRENIVQFIAELDFHINLRNAADILFTKMGVELLDKTRRVDPALAEEVAIKKQPMNAKASVSATELKRLVTNLVSQDDEVSRLVSPKAAIKRKDLEHAGAAVTETLF